MSTFTLRYTFNDTRQRSTSGSKKGTIMSRLFIQQNENYKTQTGKLNEQTGIEILKCSLKLTRHAVSFTRHGLTLNKTLLKLENLFFPTLLTESSD